MFKYLRAGENIVILVTEAPSVDGLVEDELGGEEMIEVATRADFLVGGKKATVFSRERLLLLEYTHLDEDSLGYFDLRDMEALQRSSTVPEPSNGGLEQGRLSVSEQWKASQAVAALRANPATKLAAAAQVARLVNDPKTAESDRRALADLAGRLRR